MPRLRPFKQDLIEHRMQLFESQHLDESEEAEAAQQGNGRGANLLRENGHILNDENAEVEKKPRLRVFARDRSGVHMQPPFNIDSSAEAQDNVQSP